MIHARGLLAKAGCFALLAAPVLAQLNASPGLSLSEQELNFSAFGGGDAPPPQSFSVTSTTDRALPYSVRVEGDPWITARPAKGSTPARIQIAVDQTGLAAGDYSAKVVVSTPGAADLSVAVTMTVEDSLPVLDVSPSFARLSAPQGSGDPVEQSLLIRNAGGGGALDFSASVSTDSNWLTLSQTQGQAGPNAPASLRAIVNTAGLPTGVYRGVIHVESDSGAADIPVSLAVGTPGPVLGLNFNGLIFQAREGNGNSNARNALVLNLGTGTVNWQSELLSGKEWLALSSSSARGQSTPENGGRLTLTANPGSLPPGVYYALVRVSDPNALNSPQYFTSVLNVTSADEAPTPDPSPQGLFFVGESGAPPPVVQPIRLFVSSTTPVPFQASVSTVDGADWLSIDQTSGVTSTQNTTVLSVTADASHLAPGVYTGDVTVAFPNRVIRTTNITIVVPNRGPAPSAAKGKSASGCAPSRLSLTQTGLVNSFAAPAGWPEPLIVRLADDCGDPVLDAQMIATFSNGDPPAIMKLSNPQVGLYSATWSPSHPGAQVRVTARASSAKLGDASTEIIGGVSVNKAPILAPNGTRGNANPVPGGPLAPGSIAQISGLNLATSDQAATGSPLPVSLNGTTVLIGARQAPVFSVSPGALKVQIPAELEPGREYSVMVGVDGAYATPDTLSLAPVQPAIFTDENGMSTAQGAGSTPISEASPARSGDIITIFVEGMGATTPPVSSGTAVDTLTNVQAQPVVTIAGVPAEVISAGLMPGAVGVYAIRLRIPSGIAAGDLSLIVTQNGIASNTAVLPVQ